MHSLLNLYTLLQGHPFPCFFLNPHFSSFNTSICPHPTPPTSISTAWEQVPTTGPGTEAGWLCRGCVQVLLLYLEYTRTALCHSQMPTRRDRNQIFKTTLLTELAGDLRTVGWHFQNLPSLSPCRKIQGNTGRRGQEQGQPTTESSVFLLWSRGQPCCWDMWYPCFPHYYSLYASPSVDVWIQIVVNLVLSRASELG